MWINRLYFKISNSSKNQYLAIDTRELNESGPAKFRTQADSNSQKICYYDGNKRGKTFNSFLAIRKQPLTGEKTNFSIEKRIENTTKKNTIYTDIGNELNNFNNDNVQFEQPVPGISESNTRREEIDGTKRRYRDYDRQIRKKPRIIAK